MTCRELTAFLMDYLAGDLPPEVRTEFEDHLSLCPNCRTYLRQYQQTVSSGRAAFAGPDDETPAEVPDDLVQAILAARSHASSR